MLGNQGQYTTSTELLKQGKPYMWPWWRLLRNSSLVTVGGCGPPCETFEPSDDIFVDACRHPRLKCSIEYPGHPVKCYATKLFLLWFLVFIQLLFYVAYNFLCYLCRIVLLNESIVVSSRLIVHCCSLILKSLIRFIISINIIRSLTTRSWCSLWFSTWLRGAEEPFLQYTGIIIFFADLKFTPVQPAKALFITIILLRIVVALYYYNLSCLLRTYTYLEGSVVKNIASLYYCCPCFLLNARSHGDLRLKPNPKKRSRLSAYDCDETIPPCTNNIILTSPVDRYDDTRWARWQTFIFIIDSRAKGQRVNFFPNLTTEKIPKEQSFDSFSKIEAFCCLSVFLSRRQIL